MKKKTVADDRPAKVDRMFDACGNITHLVGVDESGTGAWAGPFYVSAVLAPRKWRIDGLRDSKKTDKAFRERMFTELEGDPQVLHAEGVAHPDDITKKTHAGAYLDALVAAVAPVMERCHVPKKNLAIIVDGKGSEAMRRVLRPLGCTSVLFVTKADEFVAHVSAASIIAKFNRDLEMNLLDKKFPGYYFNKNAGYGTQEHIEALVALGPVPHVHRPEQR